MPTLKDKTIFITGASSGIGRACAEVFAEAGARLILAARRIDKLQELAAQLAGKHKTTCHVNSLDVRDKDAVERFVAQLPEGFSEIDILVNNAGLARGLDTLDKAVLDDWEEMIDTNLKGLLYVTRAVLPGMLERRRGHIINIGSIAGRYAYPGGSVYCATKFGVRALTQALLMELVDTPLRVSTVDPGLTETEFSLVRFRGDAKRAGKTYQNIRALTGRDIADAVLYCATRAPEVNVSELVIMPTTQASPYHTHRDSQRI